MNESDREGSDMISIRKLSIYLARGPSLTNITKRKLLKISIFFVFLSLTGGMI